MMVVNPPETIAIKRVRICRVSSQILKATTMVRMIPKKTAAYGLDGAKKSFQFNQFIQYTPLVCISPIYTSVQRL